MPYCQQCDTTHDEGRYCPDCGSELLQPMDDDEREAERTASTDTEDAEWGKNSEQHRDPPQSATATDGKADDGEDYFQKGAFGFSLSYPIADGWDQLLITAGLLFLAGMVVFPFVFVYGYAYRLGRAAIRGDHRPPEYDDWGGLFVDGLLVFVVGIPFLLATLVVVAIPVALAAGLDSPTVAFLAVPLYLAALYLGGGILPAFMATGSVTDTYANLRFLEFVKTTNYLKALVFGFLGAFGFTLAMMLVFVVLFITVIGIFLAIPLFVLAQPFIVFFPMLLFAYFYRESMLNGEISGMENESTLRAEF
jgi:hypothetical protein